jgi:tRNA(His) 5'-end guanylyltransferase
MSELGARMKEYEFNSLKITNVHPYQNFIVRLDGRTFSTLINPLKTIAKLDHIKKPYHPAFNEAMIHTCHDLLTEYNGVTTAYTHSDEITLIFASVSTQEEYENKKNKSVHDFNGRVIKLLTCLSGFTSVRFTHNLKNELLKYGEEEKRYIERNIENPKFTFDARLLVFPDDKQSEIVNHMIWRSKQDCFKNFVGTYARYYMSDNVLKKINTEERVEKVKSEHNVNIMEMQTFLLYGTYLKKQLINISDENSEKVIRTIIVEFSMEKIAYSSEYLDILLRKKFCMTDEMVMRVN